MGGRSGGYHARVERCSSPALIVILPAIGYIWSSGNYSTGAATAHTIILLLSGMADNILKPLMLGRGVDAPMPVILLGALGGMATGGILGMFVGATLLALGYQMFMSWVAANPDSTAAEKAGPLRHLRHRAFDQDHAAPRAEVQGVRYPDRLQRMIGL